MLKSKPKLKIKRTYRKIHISFFIGSLGIGGTEKQLLNLINSLDKKKFKIDLYLLMKEKGDLYVDLDSSVRVFLPKYKFESILSHFLNFIVNYFRISKTRPEIIHCFLPLAYLMGGLIGILNNHQNIIMSRRSLNDYQKRFKFFPVRRIELFLHKKIKLIIANSNAVKKNLIDEGAPKEKLRVIYNGFINTKYNHKESRAKLKESLAIKRNSFVFLVLANLIPYKNHKLVIRAADLLRKLTKKNFKIIFLGSGQRKYKLSLKNMIKERGVEDHFIFKNSTKKINNFLKITDVGISSSLEEGLSNSLIEFISLGIPTIATKVGGNSEITNNRNGFLIESNNEEQLMKAMKSFMLDKKLQNKKSLISKNDSKKFSLNKMVENHIALYKELRN